MDGINEAAVARGTNRDALALSADADATLPGGATPWSRELVTEDGSPSLAMDLLSDDRGGKITTEFRRPSAVKSVQSQYQPEQLHATMAFFRRKLTRSKLDKHATAAMACGFRRGSRATLDSWRWPTDRATGARNGEGWRWCPRQRVALIKFPEL